MSKIYRSVAEVCWALGLISLVISVLFRLLPSLQTKFGFSPRGGLILAATLFLCVLASGVVGKAPSSA
jgi:hypothetical protein